MEGGGAHLGSSLPMSVFHRRRLFSCAGGRLRSRVPFSFAGVVFVRRGLFSFAGGRLRSWVVVFVRVRGPSPLFVGRHHCPWAVAFVHGRSCSLVGDRLRSWAVMRFVWCCGRRSCSFVGGHHRGQLCCWWGAVVGSWWGVVVGNWWGVVVSRWCVVVVVGPCGHL